jgi:ribulose-5-phosphate 4-epimerase/fuculose-1-phosphate aldolase
MHTRRFPSEELGMDDIERQGRIDLAAAFRWTARLGMHEAIANHFTLAVTPDGSEFLINPWGRHFSEMCAKDLLRVNIEGTILSGDGTIERSAICIHGPIHARLPHAQCVLHVHSPFASALSAIKNGRLEQVHQNSARFYNEIAYDDDFNGLAVDEEEGDRICEALGKKQVLFMMHHGVTVVGSTVAEAFDRLYYLEKACEVQMRAMATGRPLNIMSPEMSEKTYRDWTVGTPPETRIEEHHFLALKRILDTQEPDYAN